VLFFVDDDRLHFGRRHRVDHELRRVIAPQHDVDALAVELVRHRLHARTAHADAGADRIGAVVVRDHRDLGAIARVAGAGLDLDQALAHFRHFELEQLHHEFRRGALMNSCGPRGSARTSNR
jgi:hypothetical protein